jgi:hypothetical protein
MTSLDLFEVAAHVQSVVDALGLQGCFIGGVAVQRWGEPRVTRDVDLSVLVPFGQERDAARRLCSVLRARVEDAESFAERYRVVLAEHAGVGVDIGLAALPFEERMIAEATEFPFATGVALRTCSAEALIVLKAFAGRPQDWLDVQRVIERRADLDWARILEDLSPLAPLKPEDDILGQLEILRGNVRDATKS